ncbi:unnamed protein product [Arabis nemorensis]|uniref:Uncharacterized protein n=1 Tax=Arabis nemorensis TaxID=586526 RepID=A0A565CLQ7_9BRAS|nr:unnamed protein product [Arabis nemorensis]
MFALPKDAGKKSSKRVSFSPCLVQGPSNGSSGSGGATVDVSDASSSESDTKEGSSPQGGASSKEESSEVESSDSEKDEGDSVYDLAPVSEHILTRDRIQRQRKKPAKYSDSNFVSEVAAVSSVFRSSRFRTQREVGRTSESQGAPVRFEAKGFLLMMQGRRICGFSSGSLKLQDCMILENKSKGRLTDDSHDGDGARCSAGETSATKRLRRRDCVSPKKRREKGPRV